MRIANCLLAVSMLTASAFAQGPNLHYRFNENGVGNPINEGAANPGPSTMIGHDTTGAGADGTSCLEGVGGTGALVFTGFYLTQANQPWTIGFAVNTEANNGTFQYFLGDGNFRMFASTNNTMRLRGPLPNLDIPNAAGRYGWTHVVVRYDPLVPALQAFVDGQPSVSVPAGPLALSSSIPLKLGGNTATAASMAAGSLMDDFRLYPRVLTDAEIAVWAGEAAAIPSFDKLMISEVHLGEPDAIELTNHSGSTVFTGGWDIAWRSGTTEVVSSPLGVFVAPGESIVIKEPGALNVAPGTSVFERFASLPGGASAITCALRDQNGEVVDEVRISASFNGSDAGTWGGAFRGLAFRNTTAASVERVWRRDSNSGKDWTAETRHSLGIESRSSGVQGTTNYQVPVVRINEVDANPDLVELYNPTATPIQLSKWFLLCSAGQNGTEVRIRPFPADAVIGANSYLVIGEFATPPAELPNNIPYVNLGAIGGGNIPYGTAEFSCALYDSYGHLIDLVRTKGTTNHVVHNVPRAPSHPTDFVGGAPRSPTKDIICRNVLGDDQNTASDWHSTSVRTMGAANIGFDGEQGRGDSVDARLSTPGLGTGLTCIVNAGSQHSGARWGFLYTHGHTQANGPILGLDIDAVINYLDLDAVGFFPQLDSSGSARIDLPFGSIPAGYDSDAVVIVLTPAGQIALYTDVLRFDT